MFIILVAINAVIKPYWDTLKKRLASDDISSLTIIQSPNLFGHPIGIAILLACGVFFVPNDFRFFFLWLIMIGIAACSNILAIWGLLKTKFFAVETISSLSFATNSIFAVLILGEHLKYFQVIAIIFALAGLILFAWPKTISGVLVFDNGVLLIIGSVILGGLASVFYKSAAFHTPNYTTFLSGRFVGDLIGWTIVWLISMIIIKRNPLSELVKVYTSKYGFGFTLGTTVTTLLSSWLIYQLPVTTMAMLSTLTFPVSYLLSKLKYKENINSRMRLGTICIIGALVLYFL